MRHTLASGAHYVPEDLITKNKFGRGSNYVRGDTYCMVRAKWNHQCIISTVKSSQQVHTSPLICSLKKRQTFTGEQPSIGLKCTLEVRCNNISFINYALSVSFRDTLLTWTVLKFIGFNFLPYY